MVTEDEISTWVTGQQRRRVVGSENGFKKTTYKIRVDVEKLMEHPHYITCQACGARCADLISLRDHQTDCIPLRDGRGIHARSIPSGGAS